jgi:hypothetical protein
VSSRLSPAVRTLIRRHISSVGGLELLLLLRAERDRSWSVDEICKGLGCPPSWASTQLEGMGRAGLFEAVEGEWRFAPATDELEDATRALAAAHRRNPRDVVRFVFATPGRRARRSSVE